MRPSVFKSGLATIFKEWLLLIRDPGGLLLLLLMPAALILIMALVQDAPFRDYQELHFDILLADEDGGALSASIRETLTKGKSFRLIDAVDGMPLSAAKLRERLLHGSNGIGLIIPKGATAEVVNAANTVANSLAPQTSAGQLPQRPPRDSLAVRLLFDPVSRPAFRLAIHAALDKAISGAATKLLLSRLRRLSGNQDDSAASPDVRQILSGLSVREEAAGQNGKVAQHINSVQHNVPAWAIFGMFFIVVPLSGHIIREREEGSALRLRLIPGAATGAAIGRILANAFVCCLQFALMCAVGRWLLPFTGLPALSLGMHPAALLPVVAATALCATAYGNLIGMTFRSGGQALPFGAISIVILSALGGIWVPVELLPPAMQAIAKVSPLHWALQGIQSVLLRDGGIGDVLLPTAILLLLAAVMWALSLWRRAGANAAL